MSISALSRSFATIGLGCALFAGSAQATTYTTFDHAAVEGTSWNNANTTPVRVNFGPGYGLGTITVTSINGGFYETILTPYPSALGDASLGGGDSLIVNAASVFRIGHGDAAPAGTLAGFDMTARLDSGTFAAGTIVEALSLDWTGSNVHQYFGVGPQFGAPYAVQLPSDGGTPLIVMAADSAGDLYGASTPGVSAGRAFPLAFPTDAFSFRFLTTASYFGGVAFDIALPEAAAVPEPQTLSLMLVSLGLLGVGLRRRQRAAAVR